MNLENLKILKNKIVLIFGILFFISFFLLIYIFNLKNDITQAKEKLNSYNTEISILEKNKKLSENWKNLENEILDLRNKKNEILNKIELLEKNKYEIENEIQENRRNFFNKNENLK